MANKQLRIHMWEDIRVMAAGKQRLGLLCFAEDVSHGVLELSISGRGGWFSSGDSQIDMKLPAADIEKVTETDCSTTFYMKNGKFPTVQIIFKNEQTKNKCRELVREMIAGQNRPPKPAKGVGGIMSKNVEISADDWQKLIDLHEKLGRLLFEVLGLLQDVSYTATVPGMAADAMRIYSELEPIGKLAFVEDVPFGIQGQN